MDQNIKTILKKNGINPSLPLTQYTSGQINTVYQVGNEFVLKIEKNLDVVAHQPELIRLSFKAGAKVPEVLDTGKTESGDYLLMRYLEGRTVAPDWLAFTKMQQESLIEQLAEQLQILHGISFSQYAIPRPQEYESWKNALHMYTDLDSINLNGLDQKTRENVDLIKRFYSEHESLLDRSAPPVLVHNDLHFENILHIDGKLTGLIDFDFARQAPKNYELWHLIDFLQEPRYYLDGLNETMWDGFVLTEELTWLRKYYPDLFTHENLPDVQRLYLIESIMYTLKDGAVAKFNQKAEAYFKTDWLERVLS